MWWVWRRLAWQWHLCNHRGSSGQVFKHPFVSWLSSWLDRKLADWSVGSGCKRWGGWRKSGRASPLWLKTGAPDMPDSPRDSCDRSTEEIKWWLAFYFYFAASSGAALIHPPLVRAFNNSTTASAPHPKCISHWAGEEWYEKNKGETKEAEVFHWRQKDRLQWRRYR